MSRGHCLAAGAEHMTNPQARRVRGILFIDYVRMVRSRHDIDWSPYLTEEDQAFLQARVEPDGWYPMETFERLGEGIGREVALGQLDAVRMWGRFQLHGLRAAYPTLIAAGEVRETLLRFQVLRRSFFDYDAIDVAEAADRRALVTIGYGMRAFPEEAACHQTMGFFEQLIELAGGKEVYAEFGSKSWLRSARTELRISWR
jgi:hypothetical protein